MGPATFTVMLIVGLLIVFGALVMRGGSGRSGPRRICADAACGHKNPRDAKFCGRCGRALHGSDTNSMKGE